MPDVPRGYILWGRITSSVLTGLGDNRPPASGWSRSPDSHALMVSQPVDLAEVLLAHQSAQTTWTRGQAQDQPPFRPSPGPRRDPRDEALLARALSFPTGCRTNRRSRQWLLHLSTTITLSGLGVAVPALPGEGHPASSVVSRVRAAELASVADRVAVAIRG
jgi:hypothetical protein